MPNWCNNTLTLKGDKKEISAFVAQSKQKKEKGKIVQLFGAFIDTPEEMINTTSPQRKGKNETEEEFKKRMCKLISKYGATNWYDWNLLNWGTKWDVRAELIEQNDNEACFKFDSAWSPPIEWLRRVARLYPKIEFKLDYEEPGMCFDGTFIVQNVTIIKNECRQPTT